MLKEFKIRLKDNGLKLTPQRLEIIKVIVENSDNHISLNDAYNKVKEKLTTISFSTLYNTIQTFSDLGIIRLFSFDGETRIEMNMESHINLIKTNSQTIIDIGDESLIEDIVKRLDLKPKESDDILVNVIINKRSNNE